MAAFPPPLLPCLACDRCCLEEESAAEGVLMGPSYRASSRAALEGEEQTRRTRRRRRRRRERGRERSLPVPFPPKPRVRSCRPCLPAWMMVGMGWGVAAAAVLRFQDVLGLDQPR